MEFVAKLITLKSFDLNFEIPRFNIAVFLFFAVFVFIFLALAFGCLSHCPERHGVVWWDVGLGWLLINGDISICSCIAKASSDLKTW